MDNGGFRQWEKIIGSSGNEEIGAVRQTDDGGYIIFGTSDFNGLTNFVLIKTDENGDLE